MLVGFHDSLDMVQSNMLMNDCDGMTMVVGLPLTDKSKGSSRNAVSLQTDLLGSGRCSFLLKSIGVLIGPLVTGTLVIAALHTGTLYTSLTARKI